MKLREIARLRDEGSIHSFKIVGEQKDWPTPIQPGLSYEVWAPPMETAEENRLRQQIAEHLETDGNCITFVASFGLPPA
jgi:hypothetical protein